MKSFRRNIRLVGALLALVFLGVSGWFGYTVYTQGARWMVSRYNTRPDHGRTSVAMGDILDRNGVLLASTDQEGDRYYAEDETVRRAVSQTVGDTLSMAGAGVQTFHEDTLLGVSGNALDKAWQLARGERTRGDTMQLTIDADLSAYVSSVFPSGREGAVVVMNYHTGEILCMVSKPDYDPENLTRSHIDTQGSAYLNRCLQGLYAPGSVMKMVTLAALLEYYPEATKQPHFCTGTSGFGRFTIRCAGGAVHGEMNLRQAFAKSCNIVFGGLTVQLGFDRMINACETMGFNDNFHFQDITLYESTFPSTVIDEGDLAWSGVGQSSVLVTPMHMCMLTCAVANDGVIPEPRLVMAVRGVSGAQKEVIYPGDYGQGMSPETAAVVKSYMQSCVERGTGGNAAIPGYTVCGKTGSAEISDNKNVPTNAWFVGFIDSDSAPYAIAVVVEGGGSGGDTAATLAGKTFAYLTTP